MIKEEIMKKMLVLIISAVFALSYFALCFADEPNATESAPIIKHKPAPMAPKIKPIKGTVKGTVTEFEKRFYRDTIIYTIKIKPAKGEEKTILVDWQNAYDDIKVGDNVVAEGKKVTKMKPKD